MSGPRLLFSPWWWWRRRRNRSDDFFTNRHVNIPNVKQADRKKKNSTFLPDIRGGHQENDERNTPGDIDETHESDDADSSSSHSTGAKDNTARMAGLSMNDPALSSIRPGPQKPIRSYSTGTPTSFRPYDNAPQYHHAYSHPSVNPYRKTPMFNILNPTFSTHWHQNGAYEHNDPQQPPPTSTPEFDPLPSSSRPNFGTGPVVYDNSFYQENISSGNMRGNTITRSYNDYSLVDTSGKC